MQTVDLKVNWRWFFGVVAVFLFAFVVSAVVISLIASLWQGAGPGHGRQIAIAASPAIGLSLVVGSLFAMRLLGMTRVGIGLVWRGFDAEKRNLAWGLALGVGIQIFSVAYEVVLRAVGIDLEPLAPYEAARASVWLGLILVIAAVILAPIGEEIFYRGFFLSPMLGSWPSWAAIVTVAIVFAMTHFQPSSFVQLVVFGVGLGWLRLRTGSLAACIVAHGINNAVSVSFLLAT